MIVEISKGKQITIPAELREQFHLDAGSRVEVIGREGEIVIRPLHDDVEDFFKKSKTIRPKVLMTAEEMDKYNEEIMS